ncbi:MAG: adenosyl-hopene transferase HpnH [Planctomycetota bacterium]|nr:MAG: adenosyl-hopene transferase HpnH [Planctomycetota bacterium]
MGVPLLQQMKVGFYIFKQKLLRKKRYPLVLMLEPLFRCNLECAGCGKIQYPEQILQRRLSVEECVQAAKECGAPVISIAGGEPLIHPEMDQIVAAYVKMKKFVYLCTNGILLKKNLKKYTPSVYLTFNVHIDGLRERHDEMVCRKGVFDKAIDAIKEAKKRGFRVNTNTTLFRGEDPEEVRKLLDFLTELGVDGITISPGYSYEKAPRQELFLQREQTKEMFQQILKDRNQKNWVFNHTPQYLDFLQGKINYQCTPWGNPTRNIFGWQRPCYLLADGGYAATFRELMEETDWEKYGTGKYEKCSNCMVHCGYEPTAVIDATSSLKGMARAAKAAING